MYDYKLTLEEVKREKDNFRRDSKLGNYTDFENNDKRKKAICEAVDKARKDLMVRTLTLKPQKSTNKNEPSDKLKEKIKEDIITCLYNEIDDYFNEPVREKPDEFDEWHNYVCLIVEDKLKEYYNGVHYGKAQKLVNMTFKYMYCYDFTNNYKDYEKYFLNCHMPLDSFTLEWFKREANRKSHTVMADKIPSWSNMQYDVYSGKIYDINGKYIYNFFVDEIRKLIVELGSNLTPFQAEFIIWPYMQLKMSAEDFLYQFKKQEPDDDQNEESSNKIRAKLKEATLKENLDDVQKRINSYLAK